jgi:hypothetical protein
MSRHHHTFRLLAAFHVTIARNSGGFCTSLFFFARALYAVALFISVLGLWLVYISIEE